MINLVLYAHCKQAFRIKFVYLAFEVQRPYAHRRRPLYLVNDTWHRQTALFVGFLLVYLH